MGSYRCQAGFTVAQGVWGMKKVAIIGKGTAGALGALHLNRYLDKSKFEVEWLFDSTIPTQSVGEGSNLELPRTLHGCSDFNHNKLITELGGCVKTGIKKAGWGDGHTFFHDFPLELVGYHFQAGMLHAFGANYLKDKVKITDKHVKSPQDLDADYVFDCSGRPKTLDGDFTIAKGIVVNTAKVWQCPWDHPRFTHTLTLARPYGWVFGVPLSNRLSIGYVYNRDFATPEMIEEDIKEVFLEYQVKPGEEGNYIEFSNYYRKENFDGRVGYSGNSSFFLEPIEATSTAVMDFCHRGMYDMIMGDKGHNQLNKEYTNLLSQTETMIAMHYYAGSPWDTPFWEYAKASAEKHIHKQKDDKLFQEVMGISLDIMNTDAKRETWSPGYSTWTPGNYTVHLDHLGIASKIRDLIE